MTTVNIEGVGPVNFPNDYTPERIKFAIENDILPRVKAKPADAGVVPAPSAGTRLGRGFMDVGDGVAQGALMVKDAVTGGDDASAFTKQKTRDIDLYEEGRGPDAGIDWVRIGGNVLGTAPAMLIPGAGAASLPLRMLSGATQGGVAGGSLFAPEGTTKGEQVALGTVAGGVLPAAATGVRKAAGALFDKAKNAMGIVAQSPARLEGEVTLKLQQQGIDFNALTQEVKTSLLDDAQRTLTAGGTLDDVALRNKATIESVGAKPTRAVVTRDPRDWQTEKNLRGIQGVGDNIVARERSNAQALTDYLQRIRTGTEGKTSTALESGESGIKAIRELDAADKKVVDDLYGAYRASGVKDVKLPETKMMAALTDVLEKVGQDNIPPAVVSRLKDFGFLGGERTRYLTVQQADTFNQLLHANKPKAGPGVKAVGDLQRALNQSLLDVPVDEKSGAQALLTARRAAADRFAQQRSSSGVEAAIDDVSPDNFVRKFVLGADARDLKGTLTTLRKAGPSGEQAIKDIKGTILDDLLLKATGASSADDLAFKAANGNIAFSGDTLSKALDKIPPEKLHQLFTPGELSSLRTLQNASKLLTKEVPFSDVNYSKTSAALANLLLKIGNTPLLGQIVQPLLGVGKLGADWVKDGVQRKQVAEALLGSAGKAGKPAISAPGAIERVLPPAVGGAAASAASY